MKKEQTTKYVNLWLNYFKQGDDMYCCLENTDTLQEAFTSHAELMRSVAMHLEEVASYLKGHEDKIEIHADTHHIGIELPTDLANLLIEKELVHYDEEMCKEHEEDDFVWGGMEEAEDWDTGHKG